MDTIHDEGWIKLYRKSIDSQVFQNDGLWKVWTWCLLKANHKDAWVLVTTGKGETEVFVERGQFIFGRKSAAKELKMPPATVQKRMLKLETMQNCVTDCDTHYSIVSILNYDLYQSQQNEEVSPKVSGKEQASITNKNDKNEKKLIGSPKGDPKVKEFFSYWEEAFKKEIGHPYTFSYGKEGPFPAIFRIFVNETKVVRAFPDDNPFGIVFGGQMQEIQRIVFGTDYLNSLRLEARVEELIEKYRKLLKDFLNKKEILEELPGYGEYKNELSLFNNWKLNGFDANWGDFSEQNAVECVDFFVEVMARSQQLSSHLPTVGGEIHIGLITKEKGFKFISKELLSHKGHEITLAED